MEKISFRVASKSVDPKQNFSKLKITRTSESTYDQGRPDVLTIVRVNP